MTRTVVRFLVSPEPIQMDRIASNTEFIDNIFRKGAFNGHAFVCSPRNVPCFELPDGCFTLSDKPVKNWVGWVASRYEEWMRMAEQLEDDSVPVAKISTPTHIFAAAFGCKVKVFEDDNPCALPLITTPDEADQLEVPDIWKSPTLYRIIELAEAVQAELGPDAILGPPDQQTGFDIACQIWDKTSLYMAMMDDSGKQAVKRLADKCSQLFTSFFLTLRDRFPTMTFGGCPGLYVPQEFGPWVSNDECGAVNVDMFEEFMLPELIELSQTFGSIGMHCCADAEHQFPSFQKIPNFYGFNRVAARRGYAPLLDHFGGLDAPVHVLAWIQDDDIKYLVSNAPEGTRFVFESNAATMEECKQWLGKMRELSPRTV